MNSILLAVLALTAVASAVLTTTDNTEFGEWSAWGPWSPCSVSCVSTRVRKCNPKSGSSMDLTTLLLLSSLGGSGSSSSMSSLLPILLNGGSMDTTTLLLFTTLGGSSTSTSSLLPLLLSGGMGSAGGSDSLTTLLLLNSLSGNSTSSSTSDLLPLILAGQGGLGGSSESEGGMLTDDPIMTLLLLNTLNENGTSGMMDLLPLLLSNSNTEPTSDMALMFLLLGMGGSSNSSSTGMDPFLLYQLLGQGLSTSSTGAQCVGSSAETMGCDAYPCTISNCLSPWQPWGECSATCGYAVKRRTRECTCTDYATRQLRCTKDVLTETSPCINNIPCEKPPGIWGEWSLYSECKPYGTKCFKSKKRMCSVELGCVGAFEQAVRCPCQTDEITNQCDVNPKDRRDCGVPGISEKSCHDFGCCFDSSLPGSIWCFYAKSA